MSSRVETIATVLMAAAAIGVAVAYVAQSRSPRRITATETTISLEDDSALIWRSSLPQIPVRAAATIVEFIDVECPFCGQYKSTLDSVKRAFGDSVDIRYVNMPIEGHRFARSGAASLECAFGRGRGHEFADVTFQYQDSIGMWSWSRYAAEAGIADTMQFKDCITRDSILSRVDRAHRDGQQLAIRGTPTVFINNWRYSMPPSVEQLTRDIRSILKGKAPG